MQTGGFTETIWHFAGYLHIADALARTPTFYEGDPRWLPPLGELDPFSAPRPGLAFDELVSQPIVLREAPVAELHHTIPSFSLPRYIAPPLKVLPQPLPGKRLDPADEIDIGARGGIRYLDRTITVEYQDGGLENLIDIRQINQQNDQDLVTSDAIRYADGSLVIPEVLHLEPEFAEMVEQAQQVVPEGLPDLTVALNAGTDDIIEMFAERGARWAETGSPNPDGSPAQTAPQGLVVDGAAGAAEPYAPTLLDIAPWRPEEAAPTIAAEATLNVLEPTGGVATLAETGLNTQINAAVILDTNEAVGSMMVGGDYFYSRGIVQVNILVDNDHVDIAIDGALAPVVQTNGNEVHNIAEFVTHLSLVDVRGAAGTPLWSVDVISGDFYDVKSVIQFNNLNDNDRVVQAESSTYFDLRTGENQQINLTEIYGSDRYDIIIIGGDYYRSDWIYQYNIVLDPDNAKVFATGDSDDDTTVTTGFNQLTNIAEIETYDAAAFKPMQQAHHDLMALLDEGATILIPNADWNLYGNASGTLNVLYVPGDYYDLNVITQVNFLIDGDQVIQASAQAGTEQGIAEGGNIALNEAYIVDPGLLSNSNYLGGDAYEESVLIQVNMITDSDTVQIHDTQTLVPELVAFAEQAEQEREQECPGPQPVDPAQHDHLMSNMLS